MYYKWTIVCNSVVGHKRASSKPSYKRKKKPWWVYCPPDSTQCSVGAKSLSMARWAKIINLRIGSCPRKRNALVLSPWRSEFYICNNVDSLGRKKKWDLFLVAHQKRQLKVYYTKYKMLYHQIVYSEMLLLHSTFFFYLE